MQDTTSRLYNLTATQAGMLFHSHYAPESGVYLLQITCTLHEPLDIERFEQAWQAVVAKYSVLRVAYIFNDQQKTQQIIEEDVAITMLRIDCTSLPEAAREDELKTYLQRDRRTAFNFASAPLMRLALLAFAEDDFRLIWTFHHSILDGRSFTHVLQEVFLRHQALQDGITWQDEHTDNFPVYLDWFEHQSWDKTREYWQAYLSGFTAPTPLPGEISGSEQGVSKTKIFSVLPQVVSGLRRVATLHGLTLNTFVLGAWGLLLMRYSGETDVVFGAARAGRHVQGLSHAQIENTVGLLINTVPVRINASLNQPAIGWLKTIRENWLALREGLREHTPLPNIQEWSDITRGSGLFDSVVVYENYLLNDLLKQQGGAWQQREFELFEQTNYALTLTAYETDGLLFKLHYNTGTTNEALIPQLAGQLQILLQSFAHLQDQADLTLGQLKWAADKDIAMALDLSREIASAAIENICIHQLFEQQAQQTPTALAVRFDGDVLTYRELDEQANQLAHVLRNMGVGPDVLVGICMERSPAMIVALLGVLKAGGAYVPLDPAHPQARLELICQDAAIKWIVSQPALKNRLPQGEFDVLFFSDHDQLIRTQPISNPVNLTIPANLSYVLFTSGTTGRPKGVALQHQNTLALLRWAKSVFSLSEMQGMLASTSIGFDLSVFEIFAPLTLGGCVNLVENVLELSAFSASDTVTLVNSVPSAISELLRIGRLPASVKTIVLAGEPLSASLVDELYKTGHIQRVIDAYGPTENTTYATYTLRQPGKPANIGRPLPGWTVYILDALGHPVPDGVPGEAYIGGAGVARGYFNRPELTGERFVPDPFQGSAGARMYRTGDLTRRLPDSRGEIEFLGRIDHQIKLRGFRIELGEIDAALNSHPHVHSALTILKGDRENQKLVSYVVQRKEISLEGTPIIAEHLSGWETIFDETYSQVVDKDSQNDFAGWKSSYTHESLAIDEVTEFMNGSINRIGLIAKNDVLEIGCGTGLIMKKIAPQTTTYWGTDLSKSVLARLQEEIAVYHWAGRVKLLQQPSHNFEALDGMLFDTIILNSVVQYFPSLDYLQKVLAACLAHLKPGGVIFLGDIRNLMSLNHFYHSVAVYQLGKNTSDGEIQQHIAKQTRQEKELVIHPRFFVQLPKLFPALTRVELQLKRGKHLNEITQFRYDVVLSTTPLEPIEFTFKDWEADSLTLPGIQALLQHNPLGLRITNIPNARLAQDVKLLDRATFQAGPHVLVDPEEIWGLGESCGYRVSVFWSLADYQKMEAVFYKDHPISLHNVAQTMDEGPLATAPIQAQIELSLAQQLREHLAKKVPEYMIPASIIFIPKIPLTTNGKLDHTKLPEPDRYLQSTASTSVGPRDALEKQIADIWKEVLQIDKAGITDNFYALGGHSLLMTQVIARIQKSLNLQVSLREFFYARTIAEQAVIVKNAVLPGAQKQLQAIYKADSGAVKISSFSQQQLLFLEKMVENSPYYNIPILFRLDGHLDVALLQDSFNELISRHEILRTVFSLNDQGQFTQIIQPQLLLQINSTLIQPLADEQKFQAACQQASEFARIPFDLISGPLLRVHLFVLSDETSLLMICMHHSISDGSSEQIILNEISAIYTAKKTNQSISLPALTVQYSDFAIWQRQHLTDELLKNEIDYWQKQLNGAPPLLNLSTDFARPPVQSFRGKTLQFQIPPELASEVKALASQANVTLFTLLLTAFNVLLSIYSGQKDILVGTPVSGRNWVEVEPLIGLFVNTLVLRADLSGKPSFMQLLQQIHRTTLDALGNQILPFERLVQALAPERTLGWTPLFQHMFVLQNIPTLPLHLPDVVLTPLVSEEWIEKNTANFDLTLSITETSAGLNSLFEYNTDLFLPATIEKMVTHYQNILKIITQTPNIPIDAINVLVPSEEDQLRSFGHILLKEEAPLQTVLEKIEEQAKNNPNGLAVIAGPHQITYAMLNASANQIAMMLIKDGCRAETRIGICLHRSPEMIPALLGVLKAGGVYIPLDPAYPSERLRYIAEDARLACIITQADTDPLFAGEFPTLLIDPDVLMTAPNIENPFRVIHAEQLAYIIYTSGTTGKPKGVGIPHRALDHFVAQAQRCYQLSADDRVLQFASISFDAAAEEIYPILCSGGSVVLRSEEMLHSPDVFLAQCSQLDITVLDLPTSFWHVLMGENKKRLAWPPRLRLTIIGGEAVQPEPVEAWRTVNTAQRMRLFNTYGPTETTIVATYADLSGQVPVSIGATLEGVFAYILSESSQLLPVGVSGELCIGGKQVGRGYINHPALTAERFIPDPFSGEPGARMYRTGDLARWLPDGSIQYLGRIDHQVKLRGFRIELGEIEAQIGVHPQIRDVLVLLREDRPGDPYLVAYLVADQPAPSFEAELRQSLKQRLPAYMIPSAFIWLNQFPLTPNGKVDRKRLPPASDSLPKKPPKTEPRNQTESQLVQIWLDVLGMQSIGVDDHFFEIGGHSLSVMQVAARIQQTFGVSIALQKFFEFPRLADLAVQIDNETLYQKQTLSAEEIDSDHEEFIL